VTEDRWADWLRRRRSGGDPDCEERIVEHLAPVRERILDNAELVAGETLLDVGCGNGLIAFGALARDAGRVVFADVSEPLLEECRETAAGLHLLDRCSFVHAPADDLSPVAEGSVDVVTTRSVLIFVEDKRRAFAEFLRTLRPGGRVSLFEPINRYGTTERRRSVFGLDVPGIAELGERVEAVFARVQPETDPMFDFDERDLVTFAERAGFFPIRLELRIDVEWAWPRDWEGFLHTAGNPKCPTFAEALDEALSPAESERFVAWLRPRVEQGTLDFRNATAYLWATKPG
jgi:arsenite methyltransferase